MTNPQRKIEHHYVDHANDAAIPEPKLENAVGGMSGHNGMSATYAHSSERTFPVTLHFMLNELKSDGLDHIISWQPHGRCFVVHKQTLFVETVLPMWFRQSKFASFQRQLNLYGFKRLTSGRDKGGYYHELFLRGKPHLANKIPRTKLKNDGARKSTSPETEPNFYGLPFLPDSVPNAAQRPVALSAESESKIAPNSVLSSTHRTIPDSIVSTGCGSSGNANVDSTYTLARLAQSTNVLRLNNNLEQLRNLDLYSRLLPALTSRSSTSAGSNTNSDVDLITRLLYRDALNNASDSTSQLSQSYNSIGHAPTPLQQLLQQQASLSAMPNSVLSSSPSILDTARLALLRHQQQQQDEQRSSILSNIISNRNNNTNNDLLALRLAIANGYTSVDHFLRDVAMGRNASLAGTGSNHSTSTGSNRS